MKTHEFYHKILDYVYINGSVNHIGITHLLKDLPMPEDTFVIGHPTREQAIRNYLKRMEDAGHIEFHTLQVVDWANDTAEEIQYNATITVKGQEYHLNYKHMVFNKWFNLSTLGCSVLAIIISIVSIYQSNMKDNEISGLIKRIKLMEKKILVLPDKAPNVLKQTIKKKYW